MHMQALDFNLNLRVELPVEEFLPSLQGPIEQHWSLSDPSRGDQCSIAGQQEPGEWLSFHPAAVAQLLQLQSVLQQGQ